LGIGDMVADHPLTPDKLHWLAQKLNHFGGVAISQESGQFRRRRRQVVGRHRDPHDSLVEYLFTGGVDKQVDKLPLPWFPSAARCSRQCREGR
jgi:hypothetical protein